MPAILHIERTGLDVSQEKEFWEMAEKILLMSAGLRSFLFCVPLQPFGKNHRQCAQ